MQRSFPKKVFVGFLVVLLSASFVPAREPIPASALAFQRLKDGNARFAADRPSARDVGADRRTELARGQHPFAVVLTCADSRLSPELIFDQGLGDLFVIRVAGNVTGPAVNGSIEYAVEHLHVSLVVVLGHEDCGLIKAALEETPPKGDLGWLVKQVRVGDDLPKGKAERLAAAIRANVLYQADVLAKQNDIIRKLVDSKQVQIAPAVYSLGTGRVKWLKDAKDKGLDEDRRKAG